MKFTDAEGRRGRRAITRDEPSRRDLAVPGRDLAYWIPAQPQEQAAVSAFNLREYWRIIVKHRWVVAAFVVVALALGAAASLLMTPTYTASATLKIDREAARIVAVEEVQPQEGGASIEFFETQYGLLKSRSLAVRVTEALGLARSDDFLGKMGVDDAQPVAGAAAPTVKAREALAVGVVQENFSVSPVRGSRLVDVSFSSPDPALSARVANAFAENFVADNLDRRFESSAYARDFLEKRLAQVKQRLEQTERQLVAYATQQQIINLQDGGNSTDPNATQSLAAADLSALNSALASAKAQRIAAEERFRQSLRTPGLGATEVLQSPTVQQLSQTRARLSAEYQEKLSIYKPDFPEMMQLRAQIDETERRLQAETQNIRSSVQGNTRETARAEYNIALNQERALSGRVEQLKSAVLDLRNRSIEYNILQREVDTNRSLYDGLLQRSKEIGVAGAVATNNISIVDRAEPPSRPSSPNIPLNMALALIIGMALGLLAAFILESLDHAIRNPADVETKLGLTLLGAIPKLQKGMTPAEAFADVRSSFTEAYYSLQTALQFSTQDGAPRSLLVTSCKAAEGKSTTSLAIARNFARMGMKTLLVDADLREPSLHDALKLDNVVGLSNLLSGGAPFEDAVQPAGAPNLDFLACGPLPPVPAELLASGRLRPFLSHVESLYDVVVIDGPPILGLADAPMISSAASATLLVMEAGGVGRNQANAAVRRLRMAGARLVGVVMTKFDARQADYSYGEAYEHVHAYGSSSGQVATV